MAKKLYMEFERMDCYRCSGNGRIREFSHIAGGVCFKCNNSKVLPATRKDVQINKAYNVALAVLAEARKVPANTLKVGDIIFQRGMPELGVKTGWFKIESITEGITKGSSLNPTDGSWIPYEKKHFNIKIGNVHSHIYEDSMVQVPIGIEKMFEIVSNALPEKYRPLLKIIDKP